MVVKDLFFCICLWVGVMEIIGLFKEEDWFFCVDNKVVDVLVLFNFEIFGDLLGILEIFEIIVLNLILNLDLLKIVIFFIKIVESFDFGNIIFVGIILRNFFSCLVWISNWIGFLFGWVCMVKVFILNFWLEILLLVNVEDFKFKVLIFFLMG